MRTARIVAVVAVLSAACFDGAPTFPESGPIVLESTPLLSGGKGVLVSEAFGGFFLIPQQDTAGAVTPRRWTNFRVEFDGVEVDSWRIDETRIGFSVPARMTGTALLDIQSAVGDSFLSTRVLGGEFRPVRAECGYFPFRPGLLPVGDRIIVSGWCSPEFLVVSQTGHAAAVIGNPSVNARFIGELSTDENVGLVFAGPSWRPNHFVAARPEPVEVTPNTWIFKVGTEIEPVESIACFSGQPGTTSVVAEVAPGVCLTHQASGNLLRNGQPTSVHLGGLSGHSFIIGPTGWSALIDVFSFGSPWPVLDASGRLAFELEDMGFVLGAAFSLDGSRLYVLANGRGNVGEFPFVVVVDIPSGEQIRRLEIPGAAGLTRVGSQIWLARQDSLGTLLEIRNAEDLASVRAISVAIDPEFAFLSRIPGETVRIVSGPTGRRAFIYSILDGSPVVRTIDLE